MRGSEELKKVVKSKAFAQLVKYVIVGAIGFVIDMGIFYLLVKVLDVHYPITATIESLFGAKVGQTTIDHNVSHIISSIIAITNNFVLNSYFTFKVTDRKVKRFFSFFGIASIGLIISTFLFTFFISIVGLDPMIAKGLAVVIVALLQFVVNKFFTFKEQSEPAA